MNLGQGTWGNHLGIDRVYDQTVQTAMKTFVLLLLCGLVGACQHPTPIPADVALTKRLVGQKEWLITERRGSTPWASNMRYLSLIPCDLAKPVPTYQYDHLTFDDGGKLTLNSSNQSTTPLDKKVIRWSVSGTDVVLIVFDFGTSTSTWKVLEYSAAKLSIETIN